MVDIIVRHRDGGDIELTDISPRKAIRLMCTECMGLGCDPGVQEAVKDCTDTRCPLHAFRGTWLPQRKEVAAKKAA